MMRLQCGVLLCVVEHQQLVRPFTDIALQFQLTHNLHLSGTVGRFSRHKVFQCSNEKLLELLYTAVSNARKISLKFLEIFLCWKARA